MKVYKPMLLLLLALAVFPSTWTVVYMAIIFLLVPLVQDMNYNRPLVEK